MYNEEKLKKDPVANFGRTYQQCAISVMDTIADPFITFDEKGICNYFYEYQKAEKEHVYKGEKGEQRLKEIISAIKLDGKGKNYDCILGISGGVDSTYLALLCKKYELRPLCVHFDNNWNSELAVKNIENIINRLGFDLYTDVINWEEFKDVQLAFLKAGVIDIEAITDVGYPGTLHKLAIDNNVSYILDGNNIVTEFTLPKAWTFKDSKNVVAIHKKYGTIPLKTLKFTPRRQTKTGMIQVVQLLNMIPYKKADIKKAIQEELGWRDYGGKHYESLWTRFYQGYILPSKFHVDKRKAHLSNLIFSGQITKAEATEELKKPIYDINKIEGDKEFVMKKLGLSIDAFEAIMQSPTRPHTDFDYTRPFFDENPTLKFIAPIWKKIRNLIYN